MKKDYFLGLSEEGFHRIAYTEWGTASTANIPTICVHGLTRNSRDFDAIADYLANAGSHVYCPDIVGRGDSDWLKNPLHYTYEQYIADMNAMIARTDSNVVDWIGTSMGGLIGMILAAQPQNPIHRLVLNDVGPQVPAKALHRLSKYAGRDPYFKSVDEAREYYKVIYSSFGNLTDEQWQKLTENSVFEISPGKYASKVDHNVKISPAKSKLAWSLILNPRKALEGTFFDIDLWHIWRKVNCPVLIVHGQYSDILTRPIIEKMRKTHFDVEVIEVPNTGHAPALQEEEYHRRIYEWLHK